MSTATATFENDTFTYNPATYVEASMKTARALPQPGMYRIRATAIGRKKDPLTGKEVLFNGYPSLVLERIELLEGDEAGGIFAVWEEVSTRPWPRKGPADTETMASRHMDLLLALEEQDGPVSGPDALARCEELLQSGQTFVVQIGYKAKDGDWANARVEAAGGKDLIAKDVRNKIWSEATFSTKDFRNAEGGYRQQTMSPSGKLMNAKLSINKFIPARLAEDMALGPFGR